MRLFELVKHATHIVVKRKLLSKPPKLCSLSGLYNGHRQSSQDFDRIAALLNRRLENEHPGKASRLDVDETDAIV